MPKYCKKMVNRIVRLIEADSYTAAEICSLVGISEETFYTWKREKVEFSEAVQKAKDKFNDNVLAECEKSLIKLIKGYDYEEVKTVFAESSKLDPATGKPLPKIKEQVKIKKHVSASLGAIIHFQTNKDSDNWKNRQTAELTGKDGKDLFAAMSDAELNKRIAELESKLNKQQGV